jgi:hypothetical protein
MDVDGNSRILYDKNYYEKNRDVLIQGSNIRTKRSRAKEKESKCTELGLPAELAPYTRVNKFRITIIIYSENVDPKIVFRLIQSHPEWSDSDTKEVEEKQRFGAIADKCKELEIPKELLYYCHVTDKSVSLISTKDDNNKRFKSLFKLIQNHPEWSQ